jgi:hypothetical protein
MANASSDVTALEAEFNERVYRLFGLTREEIALIEMASSLFHKAFTCYDIRFQRGPDATCRSSGPKRVLA